MGPFAEFRKKNLSKFLVILKIKLLTKCRCNKKKTVNGSHFEKLVPRCGQIKIPRDGKLGTICRTLKKALV